MIPKCALHLYTAQVETKTNFLPGVGKHFLSVEASFAMVLSLGWFKTYKFLKVNFILHLFPEKSVKDSYRGS